VILWGFFTIPLKAQDYPEVELYGGYQLLLDDDFFLGDEGTKLNGLDAAGEFAIKRYLGIVGEVGYGRTTFDIGNSNYDRNRMILLAGPRFSRRGEKIRFFGHVLVGLNHETSEDTLLYPQKVTTNQFAFAAGVGLDVSLGHRISIRPFQIDVISTKHSRSAGNSHENFQMRYTGGIVIKLGTVSK
jgi:hypothetical protein